MKDKFAKFLMLVFVLLCVAGCTVTTKQSLSYSVGTGDDVTVELNTTGGYSLKNAGESFEIYKDDASVATSMFLIPDGTAAYMQAAQENGGIEAEGGYTFEIEGSKFFVKELSAQTGILVQYSDDEVVSRLSYTVK